MKSRISAYDEISRVLTNYEEGTGDEQGLHELLLWLYEKWTDIMNGQYK